MKSEHDLRGKMSPSLFTQINDLFRLLNRLMQIGEVVKVQKNRVKVSFGDEVSDWLPVIPQAAGKDKSFNGARKGEQVLCLFPGGDDMGFAIRGLFSKQNPVPADAGEGVFVREFADGTKLKYDENSHELTADVKGKIIIKSYSSVEVESAAEMSFKNSVSEIKIGLGTVELKGIPGPTFGVLTEMSKCPIFGVGMMPPSLTVKASL